MTISIPAVSLNSDNGASANYRDYSSEKYPLGHYYDTYDVINILNPDYPVYCLCPQELNSRVTKFIHGFPGTVSFAVKANNDPVVLDVIHRTGINAFDVASLEEIKQIYTINPEARKLYDNPVKSKHEISLAYYQYNVRSFALDDRIELEKIAAIIGSDTDVQLSVRFKLDVSRAVLDLTSKFGADEAQAVELLKQVQKAGYRPALTFHPGSQCIDPTAYEEYLAAAARIRDKAGIPLSMLNVGGGFPADYLDSTGPPLDNYFSIIKTNFDKYFADSDCELVCEPGRSMVSTSTSLLCKVKHRRSGNVLFLNDGIYGGFMEQWVAAFDLPKKVFRGTSPLLAPVSEFKVFGPTCDSHDVFKRNLYLPETIGEGDWIEFGLMGSYGSSTSTRFNGFTSECYVIVEKGF